MIVGTINCRGLNTDLKRRLLATDLEDYNIDVLNVQETHVKESGEIILESIKCRKYRLFHSGTENNNFTGVGILIKDNNLNCSYHPVNERLCFITFEKENQKYLIINAYAFTLPVSEKNNQLREDFYNKLDDILNNYSDTQFIRIIAGDFNAKTGSGNQIYPEVVGHFGKGEINENGLALLEFCNRNNLVLSNTLFQHKLAHRSTWTSASNYNRRNPVRNQIDYIITDKRNRLHITDSRSYKGHFTFTDHNLVLMNLKEKKSVNCKYTNNNKKNTKLYQLECFNNHETKEKFKEEICKNLNKYTPQECPRENQIYNEIEEKCSVTIEETTNDIWSQIKESCSIAADKVIPKKVFVTKSQNLQIKDLSTK